jgi:hypothetical protein
MVAALTLQDVQKRLAAVVAKLTEIKTASTETSTSLPQPVEGQTGQNLFQCTFFAALMEPCKKAREFAPKPSRFLQEAR